MSFNILRKPAVALALAAGVVMAPIGAQAGSWGSDYFDKSDTDKDGALSKEEMQAARMAHMQGTDADKDGFITSDELLAQHMARMQAKKDKHFTGFAAKFDANKDGKVAMTEIQSHEPPFFAKADANGDGKLTKEEMKTAKQMWHGGMEGDKGDTE